MRELLIYRHGHAQDSAGSSDFERELRDKGKRNAQRIGLWLLRKNLIPDYIMTSPASRALRTAEKTAKTMNLASHVIKSVSDLYLAQKNDLLYQLRQVPENIKCVMLVGHNPGLEDLLVEICRNQVTTNSKGNILSPAALARVQLNFPWHRLGDDKASLVEIVYPKNLPRKFPFPNIDSDEFRSRPAYYYQQSSVIPYRVIDNAVEVMIIASSKNKHWVIPKGIHDPGLTSQESAAKEAYEEAGVEGEVAEEAIGVYRYPKWDAECEVAVYPMKVQRILHETDWQESHRGRQWVSVKDAVELLNNKDVKHLVEQLPAWLEKTAQ